MPLCEALARLEATTVASHGAGEWSAVGAAAPAPPPAAAALAAEGRACVVCDDAPREVRFRCGQACCCLGCLADLRVWAEVKAREAADERLQPPAHEVAATRGIALCPVCCEPIGDEMAEEGVRLGSAPTFVLQRGTR